jgi:hypothetical protein
VHGDITGATGSTSHDTTTTLCFHSVHRSYHHDDP